MSAAPFHWCKMISNTNILVLLQKRTKCLFELRDWKQKNVLFKMAAKLGDKRTLITTMQAQYQVCHAPIHPLSRWSLLLILYFSYAL
jgi:hypothetical protein